MARDAFELVETPEGVTFRRTSAPVSPTTLRGAAVTLFGLAVVAGALAGIHPFVGTAALVVFLVFGNLAVLVLDAESDRGAIDAVRRELTVTARAPYRSSGAAVHVDGSPLGTLVDVVAFDSVTHERGGPKRAREVTVLVDRGTSPPALVSLTSFEDPRRADTLVAALRRGASLADEAHAPIASDLVPPAPMAVMLGMVFGLPLAAPALFALEFGGAFSLRSVVVVALNVALLRLGGRWSRRLLARWSEARVAAATELLAKSSRRAGGP